MIHASTPVQAGNRRALLVVIMVAVATGFASPALSHSGGLNSQGCHNNRRTGDYHCHNGGGYSRGFSSESVNSRPSEPVCVDKVIDFVSVLLNKKNQGGNQYRWKQESGISVSKVSARLGGVDGHLFQYSVDGMRVKNFIPSSGTVTQYSFDGSPWIRSTDSSQNGATTIYLLEDNDLVIHSEEYTKTQGVDRVCR